MVIAPSLCGKMEQIAYSKETSVIVHKYNFRTNKVDEVELDKLDAEHALDYLPIFIEPIHEGFLEYVEIGMTPAEALEMPTYDLWSAVKATMDIAVEYIRQDAAQGDRP